MTYLILYFRRCIGNSDNSDSFNEEADHLERFVIKYKYIFVLRNMIFTIVMYLSNILVYSLTKCTNINIAQSIKKLEYIL